jgi:hypothetical protein
MINLNWELQTHTKYGESALLLVVRQSGAHVDATISRVDGDTGNIDGDYKAGKFVLGHFDDARPLLLEIVPQSDGSLQVVENNGTPLPAFRPSAARAKGLAPPVDTTQHTHMRNPAEPLRFSFPNLAGNVVTSKDPRFHGKVVLVTLMGSWLPRLP